MMVWDYGHTTAITKGSACQRFLHTADLLCFYRCNKLVSTTEGNSVSLVLFPLLIGKHEKSFRPLCVCVVEREKMKLDYFQNVRCFNSGFSQPTPSHVPLSVITPEVFCTAILAWCSGTSPKCSWMRFSKWTKMGSRDPSRQVSSVELFG